ncbi:NmrA domain-containing protein [Favolaschia claudopus]|uniref:NmrA domain-containing protein n=1 Tax=Favolaschia claudopus TaxID=2862362 RepID=A0AAW0BQS3_9AGAR
MTITQAQSAPLVLVVGATGQQGGSVVKALSDSKKPYRVRGFTRDNTKPAAKALEKQGVEVTGLNLVVENKDEIYKAFAGADYAFLVTNFWEHVNGEKEIAEGKLMIDAAKAAGVKGIVWSGLESHKKASGGKYTQVPHFEGKAVITEYGRGCGVPFVEVQAGLYYSNYLIQVVKDAADGSYSYRNVVAPDVPLPLIDMENDFGAYVVVQAIEAPVFPDGKSIYAATEELSWSEVARQVSEGTGKQVSFKHESFDEEVDAFVSRGIPRPFAISIAEGYLSFGEFGYFGKNPSGKREGLTHPKRSFAEWVKTADWSKAFA